MVTLCFLTHTLSAAPAGIAAAVDIGVIDKVKNYAMPVVLKELNAFNIGRIDFDKGHVDNIKLSLALKEAASV